MLGIADKREMYRKKHSLASQINNDYKKDSLLGHGTVRFGRSLLMFQRIVLHPTSGLKNKSNK
jgi:hypothetical protein